MAKKLYYQNELTSEWKEGLEASIKVGKLRNHREKTTQRNNRDLALWVALDFQDMGIMRPESLQEESWLELVNRYRIYSASLVEYSILIRWLNLFVKGSVATYPAN